MKSTSPNTMLRSQTQNKPQDSGHDTIAEFRQVSKHYASMQTPALKQADFSIGRHCITALLGGSGSGKSTILRLLAGLEVPESGSIFLDGKTVSDAKTFVPPEQRGIGLVFQDYALFPHLTVQQNIAFGLNKKRPELQAHIQSMLDLVELSELGSRFPHELSGGQRQRVAIARALAPQPSLLLLDEPFSNLDDALKAQVRRDLTRIIRAANMTAVFVTHDVRDVFAVADQLIVLDDGHVCQSGAPRQIYAHPVDPTVARIFGETTIVKARRQGSLAMCEYGQVDLGTQDFPDELLLCLRPADLRICSDSDQPGLHATVEQITFFGTFNELRLHLRPTNDLTYSTSSSPRPEQHITIPVPCGEVHEPGTEVTLSRAGEQIHFWPV